MAGEADRTERVLGVLDTSTRVVTEAIGHIKNLERDQQALKDSQERGFAEMRDTFRIQLDKVDDDLRSNSAHLDNLIRETAVTNTILQESMASSQAAEAERRAVDKEEREWRRKIEQEEREWRRKLEERQLNRKEGMEDDTRSALKKGMSEFWSIAKNPLGYLTAGLVLYFIVRQLGVPVPIATGMFPPPAVVLPAPAPTSNVKPPQ